MQTNFLVREGSCYTSHMQILIKDTRGQTLMVNTRNICAILPIQKGRKILISITGLDTEKNRNAFLLDIPSAKFFERYRFGMKENLDFLEMDFRELGAL